MAKRLIAGMLRDAIREASVTPAQIARGTGSSASEHCRYQAKSIGLSQQSIDMPVDYLGLELGLKSAKGK